MDKFMVLQKRAKKALDEYNKLRNKLEIKDPMLSETIDREAQPFIKGHFTLAVVGEMSAGKSTFINALLGQRGLLPSAHGQTTCVLTEIVDSDKEVIEVTYADGKVKAMNSNNLKKLVAIPAEFENLPVNEVNRLILCGLSLNDIYIRKESLSVLQGGISIDENLLKKYYITHDKSNIPVKVVVKYPLPTAYKGWKIVDTPGVGAIGGIEQATKEFINGKDENGFNNVDAIIFVNSGRLQLQRSGFNRFVEDTFDTIYEEARRRMFLIITCAADPTFIAHEEEEVGRAKKLFIDKYHLKEERLVRIDSICSMFLEYIKETNIDIKTLKMKVVPSDWTTEDWEASILSRNVFKAMLEEEDEEVNNQKLLEKFEEYSGINQLRKQLNDFADQEKIKLFQKLMDHINKDIISLYNVIKKKKEILNCKLRSSKEEFEKKIAKENEKLEALKSEKDTTLHKINNMYSKKEISDRFKEISTQMTNLLNFDSIYKVRHKAESLIKKVEEIKEEIYDSLISDFELSFDNCIGKLDIAMPTIDFNSIEKKARENNTIKGKIEGYQQKRTSGVIGSVKRWFGNLFGKESWGWENDYSKPIYGPDIVNHTQKLVEFKQTVVNKFETNKNIFISSICEKIDNICSEVSTVIEEKVANQQACYESVKTEDNTLILEREYEITVGELNIVEETLKQIKNI